MLTRAKDHDFGFRNADFGFRVGQLKACFVSRTHAPEIRLSLNTKSEIRIPKSEIALKMSGPGCALPFTSGPHKATHLTMCDRTCCRPARFGFVR